MSVLHSGSVKVSVRVSDWDEVVDKVQAFFDHGEGAGARSTGPLEAALFKAYIENFVKVLPEMMEIKSRAMRKSFLDILLADAFERVGLPEEMRIEARMQARAQTRVLQSGHFLPAAEISLLMGSRAKNASSLPNRLKKTGALFAIPHNGEDLFPLYALDKENAYRPYPALKEIMSILKHRREWALANWFESPNGYLDSKRPREVLGSRPEAVIAAARRESEGIQHG